MITISGDDLSHCNGIPYSCVPPLPLCSVFRRPCFQENQLFRQVEYTSPCQHPLPPKIPSRFKSPATGPSRKISAAQAIECYTLSAAYAAFQEKKRGTLEPGKLADLVVLSRDILEPSKRDHIGAAEVVMTIVGGNFVDEKGK
jgi:hypothetical protein